MNHHKPSDFEWGRTEPLPRNSLKTPKITLTINRFTPGRAQIRSRI